MEATLDYKGVCHVALAQEYHCRPGEVFLGTDSHTCNVGAFRLFATGIGNTNEASVVGTEKSLLKDTSTGKQKEKAGDKKTSHLKQLENASENLKLFKADLADYNAMAAAIMGCQGVFHVATPLPPGKITDPEREMLGPAVTGTTNVLKAASSANVCRVVVVSSMVAIEINPKDWPKDKIKDESCWSDIEFCRNNEDWYSVSKITSEEAALEYGKKTGLDVVTVNPALVLGPLLQPTFNTSCQFLVYFLKGGPDQMRNKLWHIVDVRDTADALLLVYEVNKASGRHICAPHFISARDLLDLVKSMYTDYPFMSKEVICDMDHPAPMTSDKLKKFGWSARPLKETIADTIESCKKAGFLEDVEGAPCRFPDVYNKI